MKTLDEHYKDWYGESHLNTSNIPTHDSAETCDFAQYYLSRMTEWVPIEKENPKKGIEIIAKNKHRKIVYEVKTNDDVKYICETFTHWRHIELK